MIPFIKRNWLGTIIFLVAVAFIVTAAYQPSQKKAETNPFSIGQKVVAVKNLPSVDPFPALKQKTDAGAATVIDTTIYHVRVRFIDGTEGIYHWTLFSAGEKTVPSEYWLLGNPFVVGQEVCAIPSSVQRDIPSRGAIAEIKEDYVRIEGYETFNGYALYQQCR